MSRVTSGDPARATSGPAWALATAIALIVIGALNAALEGDCRRLAANIGVMLLAGAGGLGCLRAARRTTGRSHRGWAALAVACWSWGAGQVAWTVYEELLGVATPYPALSDIGYLGFAVAAFVGIVYLAQPGIALRRRVLDALVVGAAFTLVSWVVVLETVTSSAGQSLLAIAVSVAYPASDVVLLTVTVLTVAETRDHPVRWALLSAAVVAMAASDAAFAYQVAEGTYVTGTIVEWGWRTAFALMGLAGLLVTRDPQPQPVSPPRGIARTGLLPYVPLVAAAVLAGVESTTGPGLGTVAVVLVVVLVLLVLLRQYLTVRENQELTRAVQQRETQLQRLAFHDGLTGLANRALFLDRLGHVLDTAGRSERVAVAFLDLNGFKAVNDTLGHAAGDLLLVAVAERLRGALRTGETVARLGGDEFAVLIEQGDATMTARRLLDALHEPFHVDGRTVAVSASIGVATVEPGEDVDARQAVTLLHRADLAMYEVKADGKGSIGVHPTRTYGRHAAERRPIAHGTPLHEALTAALEASPAGPAALPHPAHGVVHAVYQPVVDPVSGRIAALEALARWTRCGVEVPPDMFIPVAESAGLSSRLTTLMLEQACGQLSAWNRMLGHQRLRVAVNIDPRELGDTGLPARIAELLRRHGLGREQLSLEMTEIALNNRPDAALDVLHELRASGIRIALDDFGTGYSSLARLARTPVDTVKIDRFFVAHIDHDPQQRWFLRGLLDFTRHLGVRAIAEGVERPGQLHELRRQGCDLVQGFLVARPATGAQLTPVVVAEAPVLPPNLLVDSANGHALGRPLRLGVHRWEPAPDPG